MFKTTKQTKWLGQASLKGKHSFTKRDEFSEKFQSAFDHSCKKRKNQHQPFFLPKKLAPKTRNLRQNSVNAFEISQQHRFQLLVTLVLATLVLVVRSTGASNTGVSCWQHWCQHQCHCACSTGASNTLDIMTQFFFACFVQKLAPAWKNQHQLVGTVGTFLQLCGTCVRSEI